MGPIRAILGISVLAALSFAATPVWHVHDRLPAAGASAPAMPGPEYLQAGREAKLVRAAFDPGVPALSAAAFCAAPVLGSMASGRQTSVGPALPEFAPLYRRPPPHSSCC